MLLAPLASAVCSYIELLSTPKLLAAVLSQHVAVGFLSLLELTAKTFIGEDPLSIEGELGYICSADIALTCSENKAPLIS